jgi:2-polyprenyl-6-methoxyphenol hydroxylase-like FAD-dependent oxidoreductase
VRTGTFGPPDIELAMRSTLGGARGDITVIVAGGGIGGMALALSLHAAGITDVEVYESAPSIRELGVGINLLPHAVRELSELGLLDELRAVGIPTASLQFFSKHGRYIRGEPRGFAAGYRWPQVSIHRGQLLGVLHRAVEARLGPGAVHTDAHLVRFDPTEGGVRASFVGRDHPTRLVTGDVLVGSDGIHSVVRRMLYPAEGPPRWNGITMWRGTTEWTQLLSGRTMVVAGYTGRRVVAYPISKRHEDAGRALINWVVEAAVEDGGPMPPQNWDHAADPAEPARLLDGFRFDWLDVPSLVLAADQVHQYPMVDRDPLPQWTFGRVTLLGDAAHPMYPNGSNGASQAIIDARVLARQLALEPDVEVALASYDSLRRPVTGDVVLANRVGGTERVLDLVEQRAPNGFEHLEEVASQSEIDEIASAYRRTAGCDPEDLDKRPSLSVSPCASTPRARSSAAM